MAISLVGIILFVVGAVVIGGGLMVLVFKSMGGNEKKD